MLIESYKAEKIKRCLTKQLIVAAVIRKFFPLFVFNSCKTNLYWLNPLVNSLLNTREFIRNAIKSIGVITKLSNSDVIIDEMRILNYSGSSFLTLFNSFSPPIVSYY